MFTAYTNRVGPVSAVATELMAAPGVRGEAARNRALKSVIAPKSVLAGIAGTLANHAIAIGQVTREPSRDGTRIDMQLREWPLEFVRHNESTELLETRTREGVTKPIIHGDGEWIIFRKFFDRPWRQSACVLPAGLIWAAHANGLRDWAANAAAHGNVKLVGELPEGVSLRNASGLTAEAAAFLEMLQDLISGDAGAGIRPFGSKTEVVAANGTNYQVFSEMLLSREKAAARVYLGTDATLGASGDAPGVDISALFGIATVIVQGDLEAIEQGLNEGLYDPWTAVNDGDSRYAPRFKFQLPDPDEDRKSEQDAKRRERLFVAIKEYKANGMVLTQAEVDALAKSLRVSVVPVLAETAAVSVPLQLAPTDVARVVRVREARAAQGLQPFGDERDDLTLPELDAISQAKAKAAAETQTPQAPSGTEGASSSGA
jgi:hypothetical protein